MAGRSSGCPTARGQAARTREVALEAPGWAVVGYSRAQALAEKAVLPVDFGALDGEAEWLDEERRRLGPHRISGQPRGRPRRPVHRAAHRLCPRPAAPGVRRDPRPAHRAGARASASRRARPRMGLGKLLVVAPDQENARQYLGWLRGWVPRGAGRACGAHRHLGRAGRAGDAGRLPAAAGALDPGHRAPWPMRGWTRPRSRSAPR